MSTQSTGDLKLIKPSIIDNIEQTIEIDLAANFEKLDMEVTNRVKKVNGKQLSEEDYTSVEKIKLASIPKDTASQLADIATQQSQMLTNSEAEKQQQLASNYLKRIEDYASIISMPNNASGNVDISLGGMSLKNELNYNRDTWAEWTKTAGVVGNNTGLEFTADGSNYKTAQLNTSIKSNTNYGLIYTIVNSTFTKEFVIDSASAFGYKVLPTTIGNQKVILTSLASIASNKFYIHNSNTEPTGNKMKLIAIRIFELPLGSEIETDFNTLTADQLAVKYPYVKGGDIKNTIGSVKMVNRGKNLFNKWDFIRASIDSVTGIITYASDRLSTGKMKAKPNASYIASGYGDRSIFYAFDNNNNFIKSFSSNIFITPSNVAYMRFYATQANNIEQILKTLQIEEGTIATPYEPYVDNTTYFQSKENNLIVENRSLPNLIKDEFYYNRVIGKWKRKQNVKEYTLQASDILVYRTTDSNVDQIRILKPTGSLIYGTTSLSIVGSTILEGYIEGNLTASNWNDTILVGKYTVRAAETYLDLIVAKGTYTLETAKAALAGKTLTYQLATPLETDIDFIGEPKTYPNGSAEFAPCLWGYTSTASTVITDSRYLIKAIKKVIRLDVVKGKLIETDVTANATISTDLLSINIANIDTTKTYFYECEVDTQYTTNAYKVLDVEVDNGIVTHDYLASVADWVLTANEANATMLVCTNAGGACKAIVPARDGKMYIIKNTSGQTITVKTASSTGITVVTAKTATVVYMGTDFIKLSEV